MKTDSSNEIFSIINNLQSRLDNRTKKLQSLDLTIPQQYITSSNQQTCSNCHQLISSQPSQKESTSSLAINSLLSNEVQIRKLIREEFQSLILPYQTDVHNRISVLETKISMVTQSIPSVPIHNSNNTEDIDIKIKSLNEKIDLMISNMSSNQNEDMINKIIERLNQIEIMLKRIDIDGLAKLNVKELNEIDVNEIKDIANIKKEMSTLKTSVFSIKLNKTEENDNKKDIIDTKEIDNKIANIKKDIDSMRLDVDNIRSKEEDNEKKIMEIDNKIFIVDNTMNDFALKKEVNEQNIKISNLDKKIEEINKKPIPTFTNEITPKIEKKEEVETDIFDDLIKPKPKEEIKPIIKEEKKNNIASKIKNDDDFDDFDVEEIEEL